MPEAIEPDPNMPSPASGGATDATAQPQRLPDGALLVNDGQRQLAALGLSASEIGRRVGVTRQAVASWLAGRKLPGAPMRAKLGRTFGVAARAWDLAPEPASSPAADELEALEGEAPAGIGDLDDDQLRELAREARESRRATGISEAARVRWAQVEARAIDLLDRRQRDADRMFGPGGYGAAVLDALARLAFDFPIALRAMTAAASSLDGGRVPAVAEVDRLTALWRAAYPVEWAAAEAPNAALVTAIKSARQ